VSDGATDIRNALDMFCASCGARPGEPCCFPGGSVARILEGAGAGAVHMARLNALKSEKEEA